MNRLEGRHLRAIEVLIKHQFDQITGIAIANELGIHPKTLCKYKSMPVFKRAYEEALKRWQRSISHVPLTNRRYRLEELQKMYDEETDNKSKVLIMKQAVEEVGGDIWEELEEIREAQKGMIEPDLVVVESGGKAS